MLSGKGPGKAGGPMMYPLSFSHTQERPPPWESCHPHNIPFSFLISPQDSSASLASFYPQPCSFLWEIQCLRTHSTPPTLCSQNVVCICYMGELFPNAGSLAQVPADFWLSKKEKALKFAGNADLDGPTVTEKSFIFSVLWPWWWNWPRVSQRSFKKAKQLLFLRFLMYFF